MKIIDILREDEEGRPQLNIHHRAKLGLEVNKLESHFTRVFTAPGRNKSYTDDYGNTFYFKNIETRIAGNNTTVWTEFSVIYDFHSNMVPKTLIAEPLKVLVNSIKEAKDVDLSIFKDYRIAVWLRNYTYDGIEVSSHNNLVFQNELNQLVRNLHMFAFDINDSESEIEQKLNEHLLDIDVKFQVVDLNQVESKARKIFNSLSTGTAKAIKGDENAEYMVEYKLVNPRYRFEFVHNLSGDVVETRILTFIDCDIEHNQHSNVRPSTLVKNIIKLFKQFRITLRTNNGINNPDLKFKLIN